MKKRYIAWEKYLFTLEGTFHVISYAYKCTYKTCPKPQESYRSAEAEMLSLKYYQFSVDVIANVGHLYFNKHQTIDEITQTLKKLHISRSEVNLLCQTYLALTTANRQQDTSYLDKVLANGYIILALDGVQPRRKATKPSGS